MQHLECQGINTVVVGIGYEEIHTTGEYISISELLKACESVETLALA